MLNLRVWCKAIALAEVGSLICGPEGRYQQIGRSFSLNRVVYHEGLGVV